jgi:hypothetical protein
MLMQSVGVGWAWPCAVALMLVWSRASAAEDSSMLGCSKFNKTFFGRPTTIQMSEFSSLYIDSQYAVFICGNQVREPPSIHLVTAFAKEGESVVGFLKAKLAASGDLTIRDILLAFSEMSRRKTYNATGDADLMKVTIETVGRVKDSY